MSAADAEILRSLNGVRDVAAVAFQRAKSIGRTVDGLGWVAVLLLPLTFPAQIQLVVLGGPQVMHTGLAASLQPGRTAHVRQLP